jgi:hypothetical protein
VNEQHQQSPSITEEYEQKALAAFRTWYQQAYPTISQASAHAYLIARDAVGGLTTTQVVLLLQEHSEWTHQHPRETFESDRRGISIGEIARRHFVVHLERAIQKKGWHLVCDQGQET